MKDLTQASALLENLISEEVKRCTATLEEEKNRAQALENDYSDYIRFIVAYGVESHHRQREPQSMAACCWVWCICCKVTKMARK